MTGSIRQRNGERREHELVQTALQRLDRLPTPSVVLLQLGIGLRTAPVIRDLVNELADALHDRAAAPVIALDPNGRLLTEYSRNAHSLVGPGESVVGVPALTLIGTLRVPEYLLGPAWVVTLVEPAAAVTWPFSAMRVQAALLVRHNKWAPRSELACEAHRLLRSDAMVVVGTNGGGTTWVAATDDVDLELALARASGIDARRSPVLRRFDRWLLREDRSGIDLPDTIAVLRPGKLRLAAIETADWARRFVWRLHFLASASRTAIPKIVSAVRRRLKR